MSSLQKRIIKKTTSQDLSDAALNLLTTFPGGFRLLQVMVRFAATVTETVTVSSVPSEGAPYGVVLDTSNLSSAQNYVFRPTGVAAFDSGDQLRIESTKASATCLCYVTVIAEDLGKR